MRLALGAPGPCFPTSPRPAALGSARSLIGWSVTARPFGLLNSNRPTTRRGHAVHRSQPAPYPRAIAYGDFRRLDRSAPRIPRGKLHAERRDLLATISGL